MAQAKQKTKQEPTDNQSQSSTAIVDTNTNQTPSLLGKGRPERSSIRKLTVSAAAKVVAAPSSSAPVDTSVQVPPQSSTDTDIGLVAPTRYQPSKVFLEKCRTELKLLLESIRKTYQDEIKELYADEKLADLFVDIGEDFRKPLHRCVLVARAFKLYSTLKAFELKDETDEQRDIIVSEFQSKFNDDIILANILKGKANPPLSDNAPTGESNNDDSKDTKGESAEKGIGKQKSKEDEDKEKQESDYKRNSRKEALSILHCELPADLVSPELLLSFVRRLYSDTEINEDESLINKRLIDWIKLNRPELVRPSSLVRKALSPDHRESFRTIQPDSFIQEHHSSSIASGGNNTPVSSTISPDHHQYTPTSMQSREDTSGVDMADGDHDHEQSDLVESLTGSSSLLTRTETFEMIHKDQPVTGKRQQPTSRAPKIRGGSSNQADELIEFNSDTGDEQNDSEISKASSTAAAAYTPTTRTGLKPKTFTTPSDVKQRLARATSKQAAAATNSGSVNKTPAVAANQETPAPQTRPRGAPTAQTRSSLSKTPATAGAKGASRTIAASSMSKGSPKAPLMSTGALPITRAHPISMERSQSPATSNLIKASTKNFIAANKRLVSQMEAKRTAIASPGDQSTGAPPSNDGGDMSSEAEINLNSDSISWKAFEQQLTCENMVAQMDKFALISLSTLADCLSKMFIGEILTDSTILVRDNKQIQAHKCILSSRSAYLNDYIQQQLQVTQSSSGTNETVAKSPDLLAANSSTTTSQQHGKQALKAQVPQELTQPLLKIDLSEFSYDAVYFSMLHIYSGFSKVPEDLDMEELTKLSHLLHVTTLLQVCQHNLRMNYCHFFHKPCPTCCVGVLKTLPLAWRYDYTELYAKCLQWIGSHFASVFCLKEFADLKPSDLVEECYSATMSQLTPENIIPRTIECQKLLKNLPPVKWTETIICLVGRLLKDFCFYVADNYETILQSETFLGLGKTCWECEILEENLLAAMNHLKPDLGCKTLIQLHKIECSLESSYYGEERMAALTGGANESSTFANLISKMRKYCERYLLKEATAVVHCNSWRLVDPALQKRIKDQAILSTDFDEPIKQLAAKPKLPSTARNQQSSTSPSCERTKSPSNRSTPDSRLKSPSATYLPPPKNKVAAARHLKVLK